MRQDADETQTGGTAPAVKIRRATGADIAVLYSVRPETKQPGYFERCLGEQDENKRQVYLAAAGEKPAGYAHLVLMPRYRPFRQNDIPEIQDLYVAPELRGAGIGTALVAHCEEEALRRGAAEIGIGVGLYRDYGAAQRLYVRRGYMPDGAGVVYDNIPVTPGEMRAVDDYLCLKLVKKLL